jgi:hypothetical protein
MEWTLHLFHPLTLVESALHLDVPILSHQSRHSLLHSMDQARIHLTKARSPALPATVLRSPHQMAPRLGFTSAPSRKEWPLNPHLHFSTCNTHHLACRTACSERVSSSLSTILYHLQRCSHFYRRTESNTKVSSRRTSVQGCHEGTSIIPREPILWEVKMRMIPSQFVFFCPVRRFFTLQSPVHILFFSHLPWLVFTIGRYMDRLLCNL